MTSLEKAPEQSGALVVGEHRFGAAVVAKGTETAATAVAARARAAVEARFIMAERHPRDIAEARARILADCRRPAFAAAAWFDLRKHSRGDGFTIRFAEAAIRAMRNISVDATVVYDDDDMRTIRVEVTDLESNTTYAVDTNVRKVIERKQLRDGQVARGTRTTSTGGLVYLVDASDDDLAVKQAAAVSKAIRTQGLRHVPGDLLHEAKAAIQATGRGEFQEDAEVARKKLVDAFGAMSVSVPMLRRYLGIERLEEMDVNKFQDLRGIYAAMQDGVSWADATGGDAAPKVPAGKGVAGLDAKVAAVVDAQPVNYDELPASLSEPVEPEPPAPAKSKRAAKAEPAGETRDALLVDCIELQVRLDLDWPSLCEVIRKKGWGDVPANNELLTLDQLKKIVPWLRVQAEAAREADAREAGS